MDILDKITLTDARFVSGEGILCYEEVVDDFYNAKYIDIVTYNISQRQDELLDYLREVGKYDIPIRIITNIPNRWEEYYSKDAVEKAKKNMEMYQHKLKPESIGKLTEVFFNFNNHAKIILTNNIIYWGSANFSDESKNNYECGTLSKDKEFIEYIHNSLIPDILSDCVNYYKHNYVEYMYKIYNSKSVIHNIFEEAYNLFYIVDDDNFEEIEEIHLRDKISIKKFLENLTEKIEEIKCALLEIIFELEEEYLQEVKKFRINFKNDIHKLNNKIFLICSNLND